MIERIWIINFFCAFYGQPYIFSRFHPQWSHQAWMSEISQQVLSSRNEFARSKVIGIGFTFRAYLKLSNLNWLIVRWGVTTKMIRKRSEYIIQIIIKRTRLNSLGIYNQSITIASSFVLVYRNNNTSKKLSNWVMFDCKTYHNLIEIEFINVFPR